MTKADDNVDRTAQRRNKRKKKSNWLMKGIGGAVLLYLLLSILFSFYGTMSTTIALKGSIEEETLANGYVFRRQHLINAPVMGHLEYVVSEGDRVTEGQTLGYMYTGEYNEDTFRSIRKLNEQIARFESSAAANTYAGNGVMVEQKIAVAARDFSDIRQERDMSTLAQHKDALNILIERKYAMNDGGETDVEAQLQEAKRQLVELENSIGGEKFALRAPAAGVFSSKIDGMEHQLVLEEAENQTPGTLRELDKIELERRESIVENEPVCKVVNNYGWNFVTSVTKEQAEELTVGQAIKLKFFDLSDLPISGTIRAISQEEKDRVVLSIYTNQYVEGVYASSRAAAELIITSAEGIKVPVKSIHVKDGQAGLYVLRLGVARFVPVQVRYKNEDWAIVNAVLDTGSEYKLKIYDEVIVEAKNLEDGKVVR
ncbi:MAG: hypothetical protein IJB80_00690 [Clostridia bacterium]|nr:hypothetical protein [Clostridia bacterium]